MTDVKLKMFESAGYSVIAVNGADATQQWISHMGGDEEDAPVEWRADDPSNMLTVWCDSDLSPDEPDADGAWPVTMSNAQWIKLRGRGFLCSENV
jgi:hypothetical protein